jgi:hypothetical protein
MKRFFLFLLIINFISIGAAQKNDTIAKKDTISLDKNYLKFNKKQLIIPTVLITYGVIGLENGQIKAFNKSINQGFNKNENNSIRIDDYLQYTPILATYGLELFGVRGKNNFKDKTIILGTSYILMGITVNVLKRTTCELRPDKSKLNSFPSGHTATAFMAAEFMYQEYKDQSIWYGVSGYVIASTVGVLRMYNNRHWFTDVVAGAGIGILSTKAAYWLAPKINKMFTKNNSNSSAVLLPFYDGKNAGIGFVSTF